MGEREKGHEWVERGLSICSCGFLGDWNDNTGPLKKQWQAHVASLEAQPRTYKCVKCCDTGMFAGLPCQLCSADHPSAGQSEESLEQAILREIGNYCQHSGEPADVPGGCPTCYKISNDIMDVFKSRLTESRAAMREAAAQIVQDEMGHDPDCPWNYSPETGHVEGCTCEAKDTADKIRSLPADSSALDAERAASEDIFCKILTGELPAMAANDCDRVASALDARDARVRLEAYEVILKNFNSGASLDVCKTQLRYDIADLRRSAEKGNTEVRYECGCPPRFRVDPKEGKQYEAYCSQHHKPLRRSAETEGASEIIKSCNPDEPELTRQTPNGQWLEE